MKNAEVLKRELKRAYKVLGERAEPGNIKDINQWFKDGMITEAEKIHLLERNKQLYKECIENKKKNKAIWTREKQKEDC